MRKYHGKYRAVVEDNVDPLNQRRLRVRLPSGPDQWAVACLPPIPAALLATPRVGVTVWVEFEDGDRDHPVWVGVAWDSLGQDEIAVASAGPVRVAAPIVRLEAGMVEASGVLKCETLVANSVVASSYTPGVGNQA